MKGTRPGKIVPNNHDLAKDCQSAFFFENYDNQELISAQDLCFLKIDDDMHIDLQAKSERVNEGIVVKLSDTDDEPKGQRYPNLLDFWGQTRPRDILTPIGSETPQSPTGFSRMRGPPAPPGSSPQKNC